MTNVGFATLDVIPSMKGFQGHLEKGTRPGLLSAGRSGGTLFGDTAGRSAGQRFGSVFKSAAKAGIIGGLAVAAGAIKLGVDAFGEAREAQKVQRQTAAVLKSTGGAARLSADDVGKLANKLSYMAGVDDELVQSSANVLLTFKNIRNQQGRNNKIFDRGAKVALNMSTALGTDLKGASIQVGKALNDPVKGITALQRVGVSFTNKQKAQIKALVEGGDANAALALGLIDSTTTYNNLLKENGGNASKVAAILKSELNPEQKKSFDFYAEGNHTLEAQKRILKELGSEFGGSARSQASATDRLKVAFGNLEEKVGKALLPTVQDLSRFLLREGIPAAEKFVDWFKKDGVAGFEDFIDGAKPVAEKWLPKIGDGFKTAAHFGKNAAGFAGDMLDAFDNMPGWVKKLLVGGAAGGFAAKKFGFGKLLGGGAKAVAGGLLARGSSPANPLFVSDIGKGLGGGVGGATALGKLGRAGQVGLVAAAAVEVIAGTRQWNKDFKASVIGSQGGHGSPFGGPQSDVVTKSWTEQYANLNEEVKRNNRLFVVGKQEVEEFGGAIRERIPRTIHTTVTGWDIAQQDVRDYIALVLQARATHIDARLDAAGGTGPTQPRTKSGGGGTTPRTIGVTNNFYVSDVNAAKRRELEHEHRVSAGGFGG